MGYAIQLPGIVAKQYRATGHFRCFFTVVRILVSDILLDPLSLSLSLSLSLLPLLLLALFSNNHPTKTETDKQSNITKTQTKFHLHFNTHQNSATKNTLAESPDLDRKVKMIRSLVHRLL